MAMRMNMSLARILAVIGLVLIPLAPPMVEPVPYWASSWLSSCTP